MNSKVNVKKIAISGLLLAFGVLVPRIFHMLGNPILGQMFLPMHIGVFIAGIFLGKYYGLWIGFATPLLNFLISGMPPIPISIFMAIELAAYGFFAGFLMSDKVIPKLKIFGRDIKIYISLILTMIIGRLVYAFVLLMAAEVFAMRVPKPLSIVASTMTGIPGIIIQLVFVPVIVYALKRTTQES